MTVGKPTFLLAAYWCHTTSIYPIQWYPWVIYWKYATLIYQAFKGKSDVVCTQNSSGSFWPDYVVILTTVSQMMTISRAVSVENVTEWRVNTCTPPPPPPLPNFKVIETFDNQTCGFETMRIHMIGRLFSNRDVIMTLLWRHVYLEDAQRRVRRHHRHSSPWHTLGSGAWVRPFGTPPVWTRCGRTEAPMGQPCYRCPLPPGPDPSWTFRGRTSDVAGLWRLAAHGHVMRLFLGFGE